MDRILLVDDDRELCALLAEYLRPLGFAVEAVHDAERGVNRALSGEHALVILDVMLPGMSGFEALARIRTGSGVPVIMLTARGEEIERIVGREIGADDYLPKPFNSRELVARIGAILGRVSSAAGARSERIVVGDVELDAGARTVRRGGELVELTGAEFDLLEVLLRSAGRVVPREDLFRRVLGRGALPDDRSIDVHASKLRGKLGRKVGDAERIRAIRGAGYLYATPEGKSSEAASG